MKKTPAPTNTAAHEYQALVDNSMEAMLLTAPDGTIFFANPAACELFQMTEQDLIRQGRAAIIDDQDPRLESALAQREQTGRFAGELRFKKADGTTFPGRVSSKVFQNTHGQDRVSIIIRDLTAQQRMDTALRQSEQDYRTLFHEMLDGFALHEIIQDADGRPADYRFLAVNPAFERLTGLKAEKIIGRTVREVLPGTEPYWIEKFGRVALSGHPDSFEGYAVTLKKHFGVRAFSTGPGQFVSIFQDITARKASEEKDWRDKVWLETMVNILRYRPRSVQDFLDHTLNQAVSLSGSRYGYIYLYDEDQREFTLHTWSQEVRQDCAVKNPPVRHALDQTGIWGEAVRQRRPIILNNFQADAPRKKGYPEGHVHLKRYLTIPVFSSEKIVAVVGVANKTSDYTQTDQLELTLLMNTVWKTVEAIKTEETLHRLEWLLSTQPVATRDDVYVPPYGDVTELNTTGLIRRLVEERLLIDIASDFLDLLQTSTAIYEKNGDYALGIFSSGWCRFMDAASRNLCGTDDNRQALAGGQWLCHESCWTHNASQAIATGAPVDITCHGGIRMYGLPIYAGGEVVGAINFGYGDPPREPDNLRELAALYGVDPEELRQKAESYESRPPFIIELAKKRLAVAARMLGEIIERKQAEAEREKLQAQLIQAQKMESVGRLAGGVAHDFNNMLNVILGYSELAMQDMRREDPLYDELNEIYAAARRSSDITRQLLAFARKQTINPKVIDLNETLAGMLKMLRRLIGEEIDLSWQPGADLWPVNMDPAQVNQVLANLLVNARDAIAGVGRVVIRTANVRLAPEDCAGYTGLVPGEYVRLSVHDNGHGMDRGTLDNLFEPFFTTKEVGEGTGLGLATVYGIIKQNQGFIYADSRPDEGTIFNVYLPPHNNETEAARAAEPAQETAADGQTVLVVEDETSVLKLICRILERMGYTVLMADDPSLAIQRTEAYQGRIDLLITDVVMPKMNGRELADRLRARHPDLKVLYMSGYPDNVIGQRGVLETDTHFLEKPFSNQGLAQKVRKIIGNC